jgi:tetratricopeptide (TPR) repeat protein
MKVRGRRWKRGFGAAAIGVAVVGAVLWWHCLTRREAVEESLPPRPDLDHASAELRERIDDAERRTHSEWRAVAGLAELARLYHANGFLSEASLCERALIRLDSANPHWTYLLANIVGGYGQLEEALPLLERTVSMAPNYIPAYVRWGDALLKTNQAAQATRVYRKALALDPGSTYAALGLARDEVAAGNWSAARGQLQQIVGAHPEFTPAWTLLSTIEERLNNRAAADADRARSNGASGGMPDPWIDELMDDCYDTYRLAVAAAVAAVVPGGVEGRNKGRQLLERAVAIAPLDAGLHRLLGNLLAKMNNLPDARRHLERATELAPDESENWNNFITVLTSIGDVQATNRALAEGLRFCPQSPNLHLERGRRLERAGDLIRAAADFEEARRLRPEQSDAYVELALIRFQTGKLEEGIAEIRGALSVDPGQPAALILMAHYAVDTKDEAAAKEWIHRCRLQSRVNQEDLNSIIGQFREKFHQVP